MNRRYIDLNISEEREGKKRVRTYRLDKEDDRSDYENVMNDEEVDILDENFSYDKIGRSIITVWYIDYRRDED